MKHELLTEGGQCSFSSRRFRDLKPEGNLPPEQPELVKNNKSNCSAQVERAGLVLRLDEWKQTYPDFFSDLTIENLSAMIANAKRETAPTVLITDIDETIHNSVPHHYLVYRHYFKNLRQKLKNPHLDPQQRAQWEHLLQVTDPTYEEILMAGGTYKAYHDHGEPYHRINWQARHSLGFHDSLDLLDPQIPHIIKQMQDKYPLVGALTTRPELIQQISEERLQRDLGWHLPVITRPDRTSVNQTPSWKVVILQAICQSSGKRVVMLDDQRNLISMIQKQAIPNLQGVLIKGPITKEAASEAELPAISWSQLPAHLDEMTGLSAQ